jgi:sterol desaturase/sphingolipid hydroxylase (fatty acid hydroxylase superfamily)
MSLVMQVVSGVTKTLPLMALWWLVFAVLERLFPAVERKAVKEWGFNLSVSIVYVIVGTIAAVVGTLIGEKLRGGLHGGLITLRIGKTGSIARDIAATLLSLLIFDFFYYWWHRSEHKFSGLWAIHKLHHLDPGINVSTNFRHHWLEDVGRIPMITIPMAILFDLSPPAGGAIGFAFSAWTFFFHANLKLSLGRLSWLVDGPQVHRIHHSKLPEHFDRNFAAFFPIWDVLFRTYYHPGREEFPPTGVSGEPQVTTLREAVWLPFRTWLRASPTSADADVHEFSKHRDLKQPNSLHR